MEKETVNITFKIDKNSVVEFERWLCYHYEVISFNHLRNTDKMYNNDATFKKLVKNVKEAQKVKEDYIVKNAYKYE